jgi:hypothetical protein
VVVFQDQVVHSTLRDVKEQDGNEVDLRQCNSMVEGECPLHVSTF